jgi:Heat induced stress protein YflT domain
MCDSDSVVAVYSAQADAEDAVRHLRKAGYDIQNLSIIDKGYHIEKRVVGFYNEVDRIKQWGKSGILWGGTLGLLSGAALYVIPGISPGLMTDFIAVWIQGALGGAITVGGLCTLGAVVYSLSLPKESVLKYELAIETTDEFLLVARGTASEAAQAREMISAVWPDELGTSSRAIVAPWPGAGAVE